jgi:hypothetical protein
LAFLSAPVYEYIFNVIIRLAIAVISYWVILPIIKRITMYIHGEVENIIVDIIRRPVSLLVFALGARVALHYFELGCLRAACCARVEFLVIIIL